MSSSSHPTSLASLALPGLCAWASRPRQADDLRLPDPLRGSDQQLIIGQAPQASSSPHFMQVRFMACSVSRVSARRPCHWRPLPSANASGTMSAPGPTTFWKRIGTTTSIPMKLLTLTISPLLLLTSFAKAAEPEVLLPAGVTTPADATTRGEWLRVAHEKWLRLQLS